MKKTICVLLCLFFAISLTACGNNAQESNNGDTTYSSADVSTVVKDETEATQEKGLAMIVNGMVLDVAWEDNETVAELLAYAKNETITVNTTIYGGFEQVGSFPQSFSRNDVQMTTEPGDIALYSGDQLVVFFGSNSWSYTKLGHINLAVEKLAELLGGESAVIEIKNE